MICDSCECDIKDEITELEIAGITFGFCDKDCRDNFIEECTVITEIDQ